MAAVLAFAAPASAATVRHVGGAGATDVNLDCVATPCASIGHAVAVASDGDVIEVAPGTYTETVTVNKRLRLEGAQEGVDARTRPGTTGESILNSAGGGFSVTAGGVAIDGFLIRDATAAGPLGTGIALSAGSSGYRVMNNIIRDNPFGLYLNSDGLSQTVVRHNAFIDNNITGPSSGDAIYGDGGLSNAVVDANSFSGHTNAAIVLSHPRSADVAFTNNQLTNDNSIVLFNAHDTVIEGNTSTNPQGSAVFVGGGDAGVHIRGNTITGGVGSAVSVPDPATFAIGGKNRLIDVVGNTLTNNVRGIRVGANAMTDSLTASFNRIKGNTTAGVDNDASNPPVVAENNWWGCNEGPGLGACDVVTTNVDSSPWLVLSATAERGRVLTNGDTNPIRASFALNSSPSVFVDASDFPPTSIAFSAVLGSVPTPATTSAGVAQTLFTAGNTAGPGSVTAALDNGTATASFEVSSQAGQNGTNGTNGQDGATGPQGPAGPAGTQGPAGAEGPSTPSSPREPNPVLILSNSLRATKQRIVAVSITCPVAAGLCDGRLGIGVGRSTLGNTSFLVNGGNRAVIRIRGGAKVIKAAIKKKKVTVVVLSRDNAGTAALTSKVVKFRK